MFTVAPHFGGQELGGSSNRPREGFVNGAASDAEPLGDAVLRPACGVRGSAIGRDNRLRQDGQ